MLFCNAAQGIIETIRPRALRLQYERGDEKNAHISAPYPILNLNPSAGNGFLFSE